MVSLDLLAVLLLEQHRMLLAFVAARYLLAGCPGALGWNWTGNKIVNKKTRH